MSLIAEVDSEYESMFDLASFEHALFLYHYAISLHQMLL
jgi:hypothetical protein